MARFAAMEHVMFKVDKAQTLLLMNTQWMLRPVGRKLRTNSGSYMVYPVLQGP